MEHLCPLTVYCWPSITLATHSTLGSVTSSMVTMKLAMVMVVIHSRDCVGGGVVRRLCRWRRSEVALAVALSSRTGLLPS
jgi:hypothetical protein